MTYCLGIELDQGLVFASDSRTHAGVDQISTYRKMHTFFQEGKLASINPLSFMLVFVRFVVQFTLSSKPPVYTGNMISLKYQTRRRFMALIAALALLMLQGCAAMVVGAAVGAAATVAVETAKVPFKVTGAAIDLATDDEED